MIVTRAAEPFYALKRLNFLSGLQAQHRISLFRAKGNTILCIAWWVVKAGAKLDELIGPDFCLYFWVNPSINRNINRMEGSNTW